MPSTRQILLIDDNDAIREVTRASLELGGYEVATARSGHEGIVLSHRNPLDAILLEVRMPGLDGPTTFARLQEDAGARHVPVILFTTQTQEADRRRFAELGVAGVVFKPFNPLTLPGQIAELLGWNV